MSTLKNLIQQLYKIHLPDKVSELLLDYWWPVFMLLLSVVMLVYKWPSMNLFVGLSVIAFTSMLTWIAWRWQAMRLSVLIVAVLFFTISLVDAINPVINLLMIISAVLLVSCFFVSVLLGLRKTTVTHVHVTYLCWSFIVGGSLLLLLSPVKPVSELYYASLPLTSLEKILICIAIVMMFLYLWFQRSHARVQGEYLALLPVLVTGLYALSLLYKANIQQAGLPAGVLEHGLLLIHVPAMIIAFALFLNAAGFALLRLLSDSHWLRASQNSDIIETLQIGLENYLYGQQKFAVLSLGVGLLTGMLWSDIAWGHYWQAEPKVFMSIAVWLYYLAGLHFRLQRGMQVRPFAWWCVLGLPLILLTLLGTNMGSQGLHNFAGL